MAQATYPRALKAVLVHEGGKVDDPHDPGGRTNQGVIQRVYSAWRKRQGKTPRDVFLMEPPERDAIYRAQYWDAIRADELPAGVDYVVFDGAVNSGPSQSAKWLQRALGITADGEIGEATLAAVTAHPDHDALIAAICERRMAFLKALKTFARYGKGWTRRVSGVRQIAQAWATGSVGPAPVFTEGGNVKATVAQAKAAPAPAGGDAAIGGGVATTGLGGALQQAQDMLTPLASGSAIIGNVVAALVVTGALITVGGIGYRMWAARKAAKQADALDLAVPA